MEATDDVEFIRETMLSENDPLYRNQDSHQMMEDVVVKQEEIAEEGVQHVVMEGFDNPEEKYTPAPLAPLAPIAPAKPAPKVVNHRRCARIQKANSAAVLRYLVRRPQPTAVAQHNGHHPPLNTEHSEQQVTVDNVSIYSTPSQAASDTPAPDENMEADIESISQTLYESPTAIRMDIVSKAMAMVNDTGAPQIHNGNVPFGIRNWPLMPPMPQQPCGSQDMNVAQFVQIQMDDSTIPFFAGEGAAPAIMHGPPTNQAPAAEHRCDPCNQNFKTPTNLTKHFQTKKHAKKVTSLINRALKGVNSH